MYALAVDNPEITMIIVLNPANPVELAVCVTFNVMDYECEPLYLKLADLRKFLEVLNGKT